MNSMSGTIRILATAVVSDDSPKPCLLNGLIIAHLKLDIVNVMSTSIFLLKMFKVWIIQTPCADEAHRLLQTLFFLQL